MGRCRAGAFIKTSGLRRILADRWRAITAVAATLVCLAVPGKPALADEGGVSFWLPGLFGSLAATPQTPGFSLATIYYHTSVKAGADVAFARQVSRGNITVPFTGNVDINLKARADLGMACRATSSPKRFSARRRRSAC